MSERIEPNPDEQIPSLHECATYEEYQSLKGSWEAEGFKFDSVMPDEQLHEVVTARMKQSELFGEIRLSSAFSNKGNKLPNYTAVWHKLPEMSGQ